MRSVFIASCLAAATGLLLLPGCDSDNEEPDTPYKPIELTRQEQKAADLNSLFAYRLLAETNDGLTNLVQSPISVYSVLAMLANGAEEETRDDILNVLGTHDIESINSYLKKMLNSAPAVDNKVRFNLANSLWLNTGIKANDGYSALIGDCFGAEIHTVDLTGSSAVTEINKWCSDATDGAIPDYLDKPINGTAAIFNAIYFNGEWQTRFDPSETYTGTFHNADGSYSQVAMMKSDNQRGSYDANDMWEEITIPYGNGSFRMHLILPRINVGIPEILSCIINRTVPMPSDSPEDALIKLTIPKFSAATKQSLVPVLTRLGVEKAFTSDSKYSLICDGQLLFNTIRTETRIDVDERGTKTASVSHACGDIAPFSVEVKVDRPFIYLIRQQNTKAILTSGIINRL